MSTGRNIICHWGAVTLLAQGPAFKPLVDTVPTSEAKSCFTIIILHELYHIEALLLIPTKTKKIKKLKIKRVLSPSAF